MYFLLKVLCQAYNWTYTEAVFRRKPCEIQQAWTTAAPWGPSAFIWHSNSSSAKCKRVYCYEIPALRCTELIFGRFEENNFWENGPFNKMKATDWGHVSPLRGGTLEWIKNSFLFLKHAIQRWLLKQSIVLCREVTDLSTVKQIKRYLYYIKQEIYTQNTCS